jgi:hypothetical protein
MLHAVPYKFTRSCASGSLLLTGIDVGGPSETIVGWPAPDPTGVFFDNRTPEALQEVVKSFERHEAEFKPAACRRNAERFEQEHFQRVLRAAVGELWTRFQRAVAQGAGAARLAESITLRRVRSASWLMLILLILDVAEALRTFYSDD